MQGSGSDRINQQRSTRYRPWNASNQATTLRMPKPSLSLVRTHEVVIRELVVEVFHVGRDP